MSQDRLTWTAIVRRTLAEAAPPSYRRVYASVRPRTAAILCAGPPNFGSPVFLAARWTQNGPPKQPVRICSQWANLRTDDQNLSIVARCSHHGCSSKALSLLAFRPPNRLPSQLPLLRSITSHLSASIIVLRHSRERPALSPSQRIRREQCRTGSRRSFPLAKTKVEFAKKSFVIFLRGTVWVPSP
jgi:hypothetical protein